MEDRNAERAKQKARQKALWAGYKAAAVTSALDRAVAYTQSKCAAHIREETTVETFHPRKEMDAYDIQAMSQRLATESDSQERLRRFEERHFGNDLYESAFENADRARQEAGELATGHSSYEKGNTYVETYKSANHTPLDRNFYYTEIQDEYDPYQKSGHEYRYETSTSHETYGYENSDNTLHTSNYSEGESLHTTQRDRRESPYEDTRAHDERRSYERPHEDLRTAQHDDAFRSNDYSTPGTDRHDDYRDSSREAFPTHEELKTESSSNGYSRESYRNAAPKTQSYENSGGYSSPRTAESQRYGSEGYTERRESLKTSSSRENFPGGYEPHRLEGYETHRPAEPLSTGRREEPLTTLKTNSFEETPKYSEPGRAHETPLKTSSFEQSEPMRTGYGSPGHKSPHGINTNTASDFETANRPINTKADTTVKTGFGDSGHSSFEEMPRRAGTELKTGRENDFSTGKHVLYTAQGSDPERRASFGTELKTGSSGRQQEFRTNEPSYGSQDVLRTGNSPHTNATAVKTGESSGFKENTLNQIEQPNKNILKTGKVSSGNAEMKTGNPTSEFTAQNTLNTVTDKLSNAPNASNASQNTLRTASNPTNPLNENTSRPGSQNGVPELKTGNAKSPVHQRNVLETGNSPQASLNSLKTSAEAGGVLNARNTGMNENARSATGLKTSTAEPKKTSQNASAGLNTGSNAQSIASLKTGNPTTNAPADENIPETGNNPQSGVTGLKTGTAEKGTITAQKVNGVLATGNNPQANMTALKTGTEEGAAGKGPLKTGNNSVVNENTVKTGRKLNVRAAGKNAIKTGMPVGSVIKDANGKVVGLAMMNGTVSTETAVLTTADGTGKFFIVRTPSGIVAADSSGNIGKAEGGQFIENAKAAGIQKQVLKTSNNAKNAKNALKTKFVGEKVNLSAKVANIKNGLKHSKPGKVNGHESWIQFIGNVFSAKTKMPLAAVGPIAGPALKTEQNANLADGILQKKGKKVIVLRTKAKHRKSILDQFSKKNNIKGGFIFTDSMEEFNALKPNKNKIIALNTAAGGFASMKNGKLNTETGNVIATASSQKAGKLGGVKTKNVTIKSDGKTITKIVKTSKEGSGKLLTVARASSKVLKTGGKLAAVNGTFTSFMQGVEAGDTKSWTKNQVKKGVRRFVRRRMRRVVKKLLGVLKKMLKALIDLIKQLFVAFWPVALGLLIAVCVFSLFGFLIDDKNSWDAYSDFIVSTTEHMQSDASSCTNVEITGRDTIDWKGVFSITGGFYDGESDTSKCKPVLAWFKGNSDTGILSKIKNNIFNGGFGSANHMYSFTEDDGSGKIHIYNYNDMLKAFVKSNIWKQRVGDRKTPDLSPYEFKIDTGYSTTVDIASTGSVGDADTSDAENLIEGGTAAAQKFVKLALAQRGKPYVYGATGPNSFDCSGLVYYCLNHSGGHISRLTSKSWASSKYPSIKYSDLQTGDVMIYSSNGSASGVHHVGIYIGNGKMVHAPHTGDVVKISDVTSGYYRNQFYTAKRVFK